MQTISTRQALLIAKMYIADATQQATQQHGHRDIIAVELRQVEKILAQLASEHNATAYNRF